LRRTSRTPSYSETSLDRPARFNSGIAGRIGTDMPACEVVHTNPAEGVDSIVRLFEIHDQTWFPQFLRDEFVDGLQMILDVTNTYQPIAKLLRKRLRECGAERVLDLCSGAGGPWPSLVHHFEISGTKPPEVLLTDKYPSTRKLANFESPSASRIHFLMHSVDAAQIPEHLDGFRTLFSSFHHLNPDEARRLLQDSVHRQQGIGIFEAPARRALTLLSLLFIPIAAWLFVLFRRPFRWSRLFWTYLIPVIPFVLFFDGLISCLRAYSPAELQEMTRGLATGGYRWEIGEKSGGLLPLRVTYLVGCPGSVSAEAGDWIRPCK
jgi:hypothetical protein